MTFSSGMAAINTVVSTLHTGDHVVTSVDLYGGASILFKEVSPRLNIDFTFVEDITTPKNIEKALRPNTKARNVLFEFSYIFYYLLFNTACLDRNTHQPAVESGRHQKSGRNSASARRYHPCSGQHVSFSLLSGKNF